MARTPTTGASKKGTRMIIIVTFSRQKTVFQKGVMRFTFRVFEKLLEKILLFTFTIDQRAAQSSTAKVERKVFSNDASKSLFSAFFIEDEPGRDDTTAGERPSPAVALPLPFSNRVIPQKQ